MRLFLFICCVCCLLANLSTAQEPDEHRDPTVPSPEILQRLHQPSAEPLVEESAAAVPQTDIAPLPKILVKAIVLTDAHHGVAMLECAGQKLIVRLSRDLPQTDEMLQGFNAEGFTFHVADFSDRTLLLKTGNRTLLVQ